MGNRLMENEAARHAAKEIAAMVRAQHNGNRVDPDEVWAAFERFVNSDATNTSDALAFISLARVLLANMLDATGIDPQSVEGNGLCYVLHLMAKASAALEAATGEREIEYTGHGPALH